MKSAFRRFDRFLVLVSAASAFSVLGLAPGSATTIGGVGAVASASWSATDQENNTQGGSAQQCYGTDSSLCTAKQQVGSLPNINGTVGFAGAAALDTGGSSPSASTSASISGASSQLSEGALASTNLSYFIEVVGGPANGPASVLVNVSANYSASCALNFGSALTVCSGASYSGPVGSFTLNPKGGFVDDLLGNGTIGTSAYNNGNGTATGVYTAQNSLMVGVQYEVFLAATSTAICNGNDNTCDTSAGTSAIADPMYSIDSSVTDASSYQIIVSPDLLTLSSTPLPGALPLFATGLGALGLLGWRRKRKGAVVV